MTYNPSQGGGGNVALPPPNRGPIPSGGGIPSGPPTGRKHRHDDEEQGKLFVGGLR